MKVLILGCGWVGEAFAEYMAKQGAELHLTVTSSEKADRLRADGHTVYVVDFDIEQQLPVLLKRVDYVLTSVPATSKHTSQLLRKRFARVHQLLERIAYRKHIFLSSIGVYPDVDARIDEQYTFDLEPRLRDAELVMEQLPNTIVYRLGGLFGKQRIFAKYFVGRICHTGEQPANFVHLDDVVRLLARGFVDLPPGECYNIVCPEHPTKEAVVRASAEKYGYDLPLQFEPSNSVQKSVLGEKIIEALDYEFVYPSPLGF